MPVLITETARTQYLGTVRRYLSVSAGKPARPLAAHRLVEAYEAAVKEIAGASPSWLSHPRPYPELARYGFRWIKVHRYWFGYLPGRDPTITNILDAVSDIPAHVSADRNPVDAA